MTLDGSLHLALGLACEGARDGARARAAYEEAAACARQAGDTRLLADVAIAAAPALTSALEANPYLGQLLEDALDAIGDDDARRRIQLLARLAILLHYADPDRQRCLVEEARRVAQDTGEGTSRAIALLSHHNWLTHEPESRRERLETAQQALRAACDGSTPAAELRVRRELLADLLENAEIDNFDKELDSYERQAKAAASPRHIYWSAALRATQASVRGELSLAEQLARGARLKGRELHQDVFGAELLQRFVIRYQQGRLSELVGGLRETTEKESPYRAGAALAAVACAETGRADEARRIACWALGPDGKDMQKDVLWLGAHALLTGIRPNSRASPKSRLGLTPQKRVRSFACASAAGRSEYANATRKEEGSKGGTEINEGDSETLGSAEDDCRAQEGAL